MAESTVVYTPDNQANGVLPWMLANNGGFGSFNNIADLFGLAIIASMFGWGNGGWGGGFGGFGGGNGAGFLSNQLNNDSGRELLMNAITSSGEASRSAIQNLATTLGQDFNLVNGAVQNVQNALSTLAAQQGMSTLQVINAIQAGDTALASKFSECCCAQKLLTVEQGYQSQIRTIEQTGVLSGQADRNTATITAAIANQTAAITGYVNTLVAPVAAKVNEIASKQLPTVPVVYPNIQAVNNTPYSGGFYGYGVGNGLVF